MNANAAPCQLDVYKSQCLITDSYQQLYSLMPVLCLQLSVLSPGGPGNLYYKELMPREPFEPLLGKKTIYVF